ncbi:MAG: acetylglutamate kinase [Chloroflexota bacterium]|nr:acetylglutamate kinase [Chloroflexota bacterium]
MSKDGIIVVKIGGATLGKHDTTIDDIVHLQRQGKSLVVVHGGGKLITEWLAKQQVATRFVRGERVTDAASLEVVIAVLAGLVNKQIVADINSRSGQAIGLSGVDGAIIQAAVKNAELGYVGNILKVNAAPLLTLLQSGYVPVLAPLGLGPAGATVLNINADTVAGEIAAALGAAQLVFLTDVAGVSDSSGKLLPQLTPDEAQSLIASGVISGGMIPKVKACLRALPNASATCIIDGREPHALLRELEKKGSGTIIRLRPE